MILRLLAADPALGGAGTLRAAADGLAGEACVVVDTRQPVAVDLGAMATAHRANGALLTIAARRRAGAGGVDVILAGDDDRVMAVQPAPHPDEALSDLVDAGVYVVSPEVLDHAAGDVRELTGELLSGLLAWDAPVYVHRLDGDGGQAVP